MRGAVGVDATANVQAKNKGLPPTSFAHYVLATNCEIMTQVKPHSASVSVYFSTQKCPIHNFWIFIFP
jgi:hypothetical protein